MSEVTSLLHSTNLQQQPVVQQHVTLNQFNSNQMAHESIPAPSTSIQAQSSLTVTRSQTQTHTQEPNDININTEPTTSGKRGRGRPPLTEQQKSDKANAKKQKKT